MTPSGLSTQRHLVEKDGGTHEIVVMSPMLGESTQGPAEEDPLYITPNDCWEPPLELQKLSAWSGINTIRGGAIRSIVRNTVGMPLDFVAASEAGEPRADHERRTLELHTSLDACARRDRRNMLVDFTDLMERVKRDEEECGNGAIEVSRSRLTGEIDGLFYVPGNRIRRLRDRTGWIMLDLVGSKSKAVRFYNFGEKVAYDDAGRPMSKLAGGGRWAKNELLVFQLHTSESRDYGLPRDVAMALEYLGDKLAAESNISFFDSSGTPPTVIFVQAETTTTGGRTTFKVPQDTALRVANTLKSDGAHRHRVAIIPLPPNSKTEKHELGTNAERDMGFVNYREDLRGLTLSAMGLHGLFVAISGEGQYDAEVQRSLTLEQLFDPEQSRYERAMRHTLLRDMGYVDLKPRYKRLAVEGDEARRTGAVAMSSTGTITNREFRAAHGYGPLPEIKVGDTLADGRTVVEKTDPLPEPEAPAPAPIAKAKKPPAPGSAPDPAPEPEETELERQEREQRENEIAVYDVTLEEAAEIGRVPLGWNDSIAAKTNNPNAAPSRGGDPVPDDQDDRGLRAGIGARQRKRADNVPGTSAAQGAGRLQSAGRQRRVVHRDDRGPSGRLPQPLLQPVQLARERPLRLAGHRRVTAHHPQPAALRRPPIGPGARKRKRLAQRTALVMVAGQHVDRHRQPGQQLARHRVLLGQPVLDQVAADQHRIGRRTERRHRGNRPLGVRHGGLVGADVKVAQLREKHNPQPKGVRPLEGG